MVLVKNVMTKKVITLKENDTLGKAVNKLAAHNISGAPVVDKKKKVVGMVSESDIIKTIDAYDPRIHYDTESSFGVISAVIKHKREFNAIKKEIIRSEKILIKDFMCRKVVTVSPNDKIEHAAKLLNRHGIKRLPVVDSKGKLVGIVSRADIIRALGK